MQKTDSQAMAALDREEDKPENVEDIVWPTTLKEFGYHFNSGSYCSRRLKSDVKDNKPILLQWIKYRPMLSRFSNFALF